MTEKKVKKQQSPLSKVHGSDLTALPFLYLFFRGY
jgi:hypothetical protein